MYRIFAVKSPLFFSLACIFISCRDEEFVSPIPMLDVQEFRFVDGEQLDSIILNITYSDNGDLGLDPETPLDSPFHFHDYFYLDDNNEVKKISYTSASFDLLEFKDVKDTLEPSCEMYYRIVNSGIFMGDTLVVSPNPYYYNFHMEILTSDNQENFTKHERTFTLPYKGCPGFNVRFDNPPYSYNLFNESFSIIELRKGHGAIEYSIYAPFLVQEFDSEYLKVRIKLIDKRLNESASVETPVVKIR